jgi:hypothetical protein
MIKYTCHRMTKDEKKVIFSKIKNKIIEPFELPTFKSQINVRSGEVTIPGLDKLVPTKCPSSYHKIGDICCPVPLEDGNCPSPDKTDKNRNRVKGMPVCALNYVASTKWAYDNKGKVPQLCSELPNTLPGVKRKTQKKICDSKYELIDDKCYKHCPIGFKSDGSLCTPIEFNRKSISTKCPKNTELIKNECYQVCPFGYNSFSDYCVPTDLTAID